MYNFFKLLHFLTHYSTSAILRGIRIHGRHGMQSKPKNSSFFRTAGSSVTMNEHDALQLRDNQQKYANVFLIYLSSYKLLKHLICV